MAPRAPTGGPYDRSEAFLRLLESHHTVILDAAVRREESKMVVYNGPLVEKFNVD